MADIALIRITRVEALDTQQPVAEPLTVRYWMDVKLAGGVVRSFYVDRQTDGTILDDTAFGVWWDDVVTDAQSAFGTNPIVWEDAKIQLPSDW